MKQAITYLLASILWAMPLLVKAALTIEISGGVEGALPIAVVPFDTSKLSGKLPVDLARIVSSDLNRSGVLSSMSRRGL